MIRATYPTILCCAVAKQVALKPRLHERFFACDGDAIFLKLSRRQRAAKIAYVATRAEKGWAMKRARPSKKV